MRLDLGDEFLAIEHQVRGETGRGIVGRTTVDRLVVRRERRRLLTVHPLEVVLAGHLDREAEPEVVAEADVALDVIGLRASDQAPVDGGLDPLAPLIVVTDSEAGEEDTAVEGDIGGGVRELLVHEELHPARRLRRRLVLGVGRHRLDEHHLLLGLDDREWRNGLQALDGRHEPGPELRHEHHLLDLAVSGVQHLHREVMVVEGGQLLDCLGSELRHELLALGGIVQVGAQGLKMLRDLGVLGRPPGVGLGDRASADPDIADVVGIAGIGEGGGALAHRPVREAAHARSAELEPAALVGAGARGQAEGHEVVEQEALVDLHQLGGVARDLDIGDGAQPLAKVDRRPRIVQHPGQVGPHRPQLDDGVCP